MDYYWVEYLEILFLNIRFFCIVRLIFLIFWQKITFARIWANFTVTYCRYSRKANDGLIKIKGKSTKLDFLNMTTLNETDFYTPKRTSKFVPIRFFLIKFDNITVSYSILKKNFKKLFTFRGQISTLTVV